MLTFNGLIQKWDKQTHLEHNDGHYLTQKSLKIPNDLPEYLCLFACWHFLNINVKFVGLFELSNYNYKSVMLYLSNTTYIAYLFYILV